MLGHAFIGLAIGQATEPPVRGHSAPHGLGGRAGCWLPAVLTPAYLPDIVAQLGFIAGWSDSRLLGHSVIFAVAASPGIAVVFAADPPIAAWRNARAVWLGRAFICGIVLAAVVTHSLRDVRDAQLETGRALIGQRAYQDRLKVLALAERWPATTKPGRIDHVRAGGQQTRT